MTNEGPRRSDFSEEWLIALERTNQYQDDLEYHNTLISFLLNLNPKRPPVIEPPPRTTAPSGGANFVRARGSVKRSTQVRYLLLQAQCGVTDCLGKKARLLLVVDNAYVQVADLWKNAHNVLHDALLYADPFLAAYEQAREYNTTQLPDDHVYSLLKPVLISLRIVADSVKKKLSSSIYEMERKKKKSEEKLEEMEAKRDEIKAWKGEEWWKYHQKREGRVDWAAIRAALRREIREIGEALEDIQRNELVSKMNGIVGQLYTAVPTTHDNTH